MKSLRVMILLNLMFVSVAFAGNGVERGSVMIKGASDINPEIKSYIGKVLSKCSSNLEREHFEVEEVSTRRERIDQGIIDVFYKFKLKHIAEKNIVLNSITIEVMDSDFHNWRNYEEKLSFEVVNDQNNSCF